MSKDDEKDVVVKESKPKVVVSPEFIAAKKRDLDIEVARRGAGLTYSI